MPRNARRVPSNPEYQMQRYFITYCKDWPRSRYDRPLPLRASMQHGGGRKTIIRPVKVGNTLEGRGPSRSPPARAVVRRARIASPPILFNNHYSLYISLINRSRWGGIDSVAAAANVTGTAKLGKWFLYGGKNVTWGLYRNYPLARIGEI